jgi:polyribonucleotide nucleotidyltransferase
MDFKVAGTGNGITGIQLDLKARGIPHDLIVKTLEQARDARLKILRDMLATLNRPRAQISIHAPRLLRIQVNPEKIGRIIGPGGKNIQKLQKDTGCSINIEDDGTVEIAGVGEGAERAKQAIELIAEEVKVGRVYTGKVISIKDFGAFVELTPGQDGLCHISELAEGYVGKVTDVVQIGDVVKVKVIAVDDQGRIKLSRKAVLRDEGGGATFGGDAAPAGAQREMAGEQRAPRREGGRPEAGREGGGDRPPRREGGGREGGGREGGRPPARETGGREGGRAEGGRMEGGESRIDRVGDRAEGDRVQPRGGDRPPRREGGGREGGGREGGGREGQGGGRPPRREGGEAPPPPRPTRYDDNIDDFDAEPVEDDVVPPPPPPRRSGGQGNGGGREGGRGREGGGREGSGREGGRGGPPRREGGQPRREGGRQEPPPRPAPPEDDFEGRLTDDDL